MQRPRFTDAVRDMRMLRIEENNDLLPAVDVGTMISAVAAA